MRCLFCFVASISLLLALAPRASAIDVWHRQPRHMPAGTVALDTLPAVITDACIEARIAPDGKGASTWSLAWGAPDGSRVVAQVSAPDAHMLDDVITPKAHVAVSQVLYGTVTPIGSADVGADDRYVTLRVVHDGYSARLYAGSGMQQLVCDVPLGAGAVELTSTAPYSCRRLLTRCEGLPPIEKCHYKSMLALNRHLRSTTDPLEGHWEYLDRDIDRDQARMGGRYKLSIVANDQGGYDIAYIDGATINPQMWQPLSLKGRLRPTVFANDYDLEWRDAEGYVLDDDNSAQLSDDGMILTLRFPLYKSQMRLKRVVD